MNSRSLGREVTPSQHVGVQDLEGAAGARREVHLRPHHRHRGHRHGARNRRSAGILEVSTIFHNIGRGS